MGLGLEKTGQWVGVREKENGAAKMMPRSWSTVEWFCVCWEEALGEAVLVGAIKN